MRQKPACFAQFEGHKYQEVALNEKHEELIKSLDFEKVADRRGEFEVKYVDRRNVDEHIEHQAELKTGFSHVFRRRKVIKEFGEVLKYVKTDGGFEQDVHEGRFTRLEGVSVRDNERGHREQRQRNAYVAQCLDNRYFAVVDPKVDALSNLVDGDAKARGHAKGRSVRWQCARPPGRGLTGWRRS